MLSRRRQRRNTDCVLRRKLVGDLLRHDTVQVTPAVAQPALSLSKGLASFETWVVSASRVDPRPPRTLQTPRHSCGAEVSIACATTEHTLRRCPSRPPGSRTPRDPGHPRHLQFSQTMWPDPGHPAIPYSGLFSLSGSRTPSSLRIRPITFPIPSDLLLESPANFSSSLSKICLLPSLSTNR